MQADNSKKIILDLCGGTGSWSKPYKDAGYDVRLITLPDYDVKHVVFASDYMTFNKQTYSVYDMGIYYADVYGILAAPPCTEFSIAKGNKARDFSAAMEIVNACMRVIWICRIEGNLKFWAVENPVGFLRQFLGVPKYQFEHWEFGEWQIKPTDLWGYFREPKKTHTERPAMMSITHPNGRVNGRGWAKPECPAEYKHLNLDRAALRAITPAGFAKAFFAANQ